MDRLSPPNTLVMEGNLLQNWKKWKQDFIIYLAATESTKKPDETKSSILLHCIGEKGREVYNTFNLTEENSLNFEAIMTNFDKFFEPRKNVTFSRFKFFTYRQKEGETFNKYITELKKLSNDCELQDLKNELLRDMLIIGLHDKNLKERLLRESNLDLEKTIQICQSVEISRAHLKSIHDENSTIFKDNYNNVDYLCKNRSFNPKSQNRNKKDEIIKKCKFCSFSHKRGSCPAYTKSCNICYKRGHFANCCTERKKNIQKIDIEDNDQIENDFFIGAIDNNNENISHSWTIKLNLDGTLISFKIDSGAQVNVLPLSKFNLLNPIPDIFESNIKLTAYNGENIPICGTCLINVRYQEKSHQIKFVIAETTSSPIIGLETSIKLNLIKRICHVVNQQIPVYLEKFSSCFGKIGKLKYPHHIVIDKNIKPVINPPRRLPIALKERLHEELRRMTEMGIIKPINEPTNWVSSLVIVEKSNGKLRICLDPRNLNKAIKRPQHAVPTTEEILAKLAHAKIFTKLDASNAYWQIPLDEESSKLVTFNTPFGRYRFLRMPYGIHSASDVCQSRISQMIDNIECVVNSQDDIIIWAENRDKLRERTIKVFKSLKEHGLVLNKDKCQFEQTEITFLGHKITSEGIFPDDKKIEAIINMPYPQNVKELQRFMGMINYLGKFIPSLSDKTVNLRKLLEKDIAWSLEKQHKTEIDNLKNEITKSPILKFFNPKLPIKVSCDASKTGLGTILEQKIDNDWHPIAFASRSLTTSEKNYCQLEKETLSIVFACSKFHDYLYGHNFDVYNDHLPLKPIFEKSIIKSPPRIQRFLLRLQRYNFKMHYIPGKLLTIPDTLSRASLSNSTPELHPTEIDSYVHTVESQYLISDSRLQQFRDETRKDENLMLLKDYILNGWPKSQKLVPVSIRPYYIYRQHLTYSNGIIYKDTQFIVPLSLRKEIKDILHAGHLGIVKMKTNARSIIFWPQINNDIENIVNNCEMCQKYQNSQPSEPLIEHDTPKNPWTKVGTDLFELNNKSYLIIVDYTSNFFDLSQLPNKLSKTIVLHTKRIFSKFGIPKTVVSDNGPEFSGEPYQIFSRQWDFQHVTSSPKYPQSNGKVERTIQTIKKSLRKAFENKDDPYLALLSLRTNPGPHNTLPPATKFFTRPIRNLLPCLVKPKRTNGTITKKPHPNWNINKELPELKKGDLVRIYEHGNWSRKGKIIAKSKYPRSYIITTGNKTLRRNRKQIKLIKGICNDINDYCTSIDMETLITESLSNENNNDPSRDNPVITKSGRITRPPKRFEDYVTNF